MEGKTKQSIIDLVNKLALNTDIIKFIKKENKNNLIEYCLSPFCAVIQIDECDWADLYDKLQKIFPYFDFNIEHCDFDFLSKGKLLFSMEFNANSKDSKLENFIKNRIALLKPRIKRKIKNIIQHFNSSTKKLSVCPVYNNSYNILVLSNKIIVSSKLIPSVLNFIKYELGINYETQIDKKYLYIYKYNILCGK